MASLGDVSYTAVAAAVFLATLGWIIIAVLLERAGTNNEKRARLVTLVIYVIYVLVAAYVIRWMADSPVYPGDKPGP